MSVDTSPIDVLNHNLSKYAQVSKLTLAQVLDKKGNDLRIQLFRGFWNHKFGNGKKGGIAWRELAKRSRAGLGTLVRKLFLDSANGTTPETDKRGRRLSLWQRLVAQETMRREAGIGILGISFLSRRFRNKKAGNIIQRYTVANVSKTLGELVRISNDGESYVIRGMTPGMKEISERYGIKDVAIGAVNADMLPYLRRKFSEAAEVSIGKAS